MQTFDKIRQREVQRMQLYPDRIQKKIELIQSLYETADETTILFSADLNVIWSNCSNHALIAETEQLLRRHGSYEIPGGSYYWTLLPAPRRCSIQKIEDHNREYHLYLFQIREPETDIQIQKQALLYLHEQINAIRFAVSSITSSNVMLLQSADTASPNEILDYLNEAENQCYTLMQSTLLINEILHYTNQNNEVSPIDLSVTLEQILSNCQTILGSQIILHYQIEPCLSYCGNADRLETVLLCILLTLHAGISPAASVQITAASDENGIVIEIMLTEKDTTDIQQPELPTVTPIDPVQLKHVIELFCCTYHAAFEEYPAEHRCLLRLSHVSDQAPSVLCTPAASYIDEPFSKQRILLSALIKIPFF